MFHCVHEVVVSLLSRIEEKSEIYFHKINQRPRKAFYEILWRPMSEWLPIMYITREFSLRSNTRGREREKNCQNQQSEMFNPLAATKCHSLWISAALSRTQKGDRKGDFSRFSLDAFVYTQKRDLSIVDGGGGRSTFGSWSNY